MRLTIFDERLLLLFYVTGSVSSVALRRAIDTFWNRCAHDASCMRIQAHNSRLNPLATDHMQTVRRVEASTG
jgi:hypothetical protein